MMLYGVRWPDDPPFRIDARHPPKISTCNPRVTVRSTAQPQCWLSLFKDAGKRASAHKGASPAFGPGDMMLYRSHYGDLQFFHAMASYDGETAAETRAKMTMWATFLWGAATKKLRMDVPLRDVGIEDLGTFFPGEMTATNLFATASWRPAHIWMKSRWGRYCIWSRTASPRHTSFDWNPAAGDALA